MARLAQLPQHFAEFQSHKANLRAGGGEIPIFLGFDSLAKSLHISRADRVN